MKRIISILLCAALLAAVCMIPVFASSEEMDEEARKEARLAELTSAMVELLEIDDSYTSFQSSYNDGIRPGWYLYWSKDEGSVSVNCTEDGLVTDYSRWDNGRGDLFYGFKAALPAMSLAEAQASAEDWLSRLLAEEESPRFDNHWSSLTKDGGYSFSGRILKNGLESPVTFNITVKANGLYTYYRSDGYKGYVGELPGAEPAVDEAAAAEALAGEVILDIYYVRGDDGEARLRYVSIGNRFVVDAQTGEAVDMDLLYSSTDAWYEEPAAAEMAMDSKAMGMGDGGSGRSLTEVELSSIAQYADVIPEEDLDESVRALPNIGLEDFRLSRCSYVMNDDGVFAQMNYNAEMGPDRLFGYSQEDYDDYMSWSSSKAIVSKYITLNAKTGELITVSTSYPLWSNRYDEYDDMGEELADAFLSAAAPEHFAESVFREGSSGYGSSSLTYYRVHDGYDYPANYFRVGMNMATGTVDDYYFEWDEDVTFAPSEGIIDQDEALSVYSGAQTVTLGYVTWPEGVDYSNPIYDTYIRWGYTYVESLRLGWYYSNSSLQGVDALTGEALIDKTAEPLAYDDLDGAAEAEIILTLAENGIGFAGGSFLPDAALTMKDAVTLLLRAAGYSTDYWDDDALRNEAQWQGFIGPDEWEPDREVTRAEFIRMILGASQYGAAAELADIWAGDFTDVAEEDIGIAAIARALGMTDGEGLYETADHTDAAVILYAFMAR